METEGVEFWFSLLFLNQRIIRMYYRSKYKRSTIKPLDKNTGRNLHSFQVGKNFSGKTLKAPVIRFFK